MNIDGLNIDVSEKNDIEIEDGNAFSRSKIIISGEGNVVKIGKANRYDQLVINLKGNNKSIVIGESNRNINNLKITSIRGARQSVTIGRNFSCGGLEIQMNDGDENVVIGDDCLFSWGIKMRTSDGHSVIDLTTGVAINLPQDIFISSHVWCGEDVKFLKGAAIASECVVGSGSIVTKAIPDENCLIAGVPAGVVRRGVSWDRRMPSKYNEER